MPSKLDALRAHAESLVGPIPIRELEPSDPDARGLSASSPARVVESRAGDHEVLILSGLDEDSREQALGHEIMHLVLSADGLAAYFYGEGETIADCPDALLQLELNNFLSHCRLVDRLRDEFGIGSSLHLSLRKGDLSNAREDIAYFEGRANGALSADEARTLLHALGFRLADIAATCPAAEAEARRIAQSSEPVRAAFELAESELQFDFVGHDKQKQREIVRKGLAALEQTRQLRIA